MRSFIALRGKFMGTPANPAAGEGLLYFKTDGKLYKKIGATESSVEGGVSSGVSAITGMASSIGGGLYIGNGAWSTPLSSTFTPPAGARIAVFNVSGGFRAAGNAAAYIYLNIAGATRRAIRLHNDADVAKTPSGSISFMYQVAGITSPIAFDITINPDSGGSPISTTPINWSIDYIS